MAESDSYYHESYLINLFKVIKTGDFNEKALTKKPHEMLRINSICQKMFSQDYFLHIIDNTHGTLCSHYPPKILVPYQMNDTDKKCENSSYMMENNIFLQYLHNSLNARCRSRFPVPVLSFKNKFLCRSSTLSGTVEIYGRKYLSNVFGSGNINSSHPTAGKEHFDQIRGEDKKLLQHLNIKYIFDLMLENKKLMFGFPVSSSEKVDRHNRYKEFTIISLPYPGCEFFNDWRLSQYQMKGLFFEWDKIEINSKLHVPLTFTPAMCNGIKWDEYTTWDLTQLTTNYLKLILGIMVEENSGVLVHCISGWDRTPLFASLVRCLLWADGMLHESLPASQLLYLTLAYDWFLFGHQTRTRIQMGEEILRFTFTYLSRAAAEDLSTSVVHVYGGFIDTFCRRLHRSNSEADLTSTYSLQESANERQRRLVELGLLFEKSYSQEIAGMVGKGSGKKHSKQLISSASSLLNGIFGNYNISNPNTSVLESSTSSSDNNARQNTSWYTN